MQSTRFTICFNTFLTIYSLDILPITCDACRKTVCRRHITYESHRCEHGHKKVKNTQKECIINRAISEYHSSIVPIVVASNFSQIVFISLFSGKPVPVGRNNDPNIKINEHIERDCQSDPADRHRRRQLRCQLATCRNVEVCVLLLHLF